MLPYGKLYLDGAISDIEWQGIGLTPIKDDAILPESIFSNYYSEHYSLDCSEEELNQESVLAYSVDYDMEIYDSNEMGLVIDHENNSIRSSRLIAYVVKIPPKDSSGLEKEIVWSWKLQNLDADMIQIN